MKTIKSLFLFFAALICTLSISAQNADEIFEKYFEAIGGKDKIAAINSLYTEYSVDIMGMVGTMKSTVLNGKGMRQDIDIMGSIISTCYTDSAGWSMNPMTGSYSAELMTEQQYKAGKDQIFVEGQLLNYAKNGASTEYLGTETVKGVDAHKIKITQPDSTSALYYFDPETYLLIYSLQQAEMQGTMTDNKMTFSDYRDVDGYKIPFKLDMDMAGGMFTMAMTVTKAELNKEIDESIFDKP